MIIYNFIKSCFLHIKYTRFLKKIYKEENLINNLSSLFDANFKVDWVNRIYAVINPNITNGKYDTSSQIFEYDERGLVNKSYIEKWIMDRMNIAAQFIKNNDLFDLCTYEITQLDNYDNFLFTIKPITFDDFVKNTKKFLILLSILIVLAGILMLTIF